MNNNKDIYYQRFNLSNQDENSNAAFSSKKKSKKYLEKTESTSYTSLDTLEKDFKGNFAFHNDIPM